MSTARWNCFAFSFFPPLNDRWRFPVVHTFPFRCAFTTQDLDEASYHTFNEATAHSIPRDFGWFRLCLFGLSWVGGCWVGLGWAGLAWIGLVWVGFGCVVLAWIWLGWAGLGWVGSCWAVLGWAGLGWAGFGTGGLG